MARSYYRRPSETTLSDLAEGIDIRGDRLDRITSHAALWVEDPSRVGLENQETAIMLYGLGFSIPRGRGVESADIIPPNWDTNTTGMWEVHLTLSDGRTTMRTTENTDLIKAPYYGVAARLRYEGIDTGDFINSP